MGFSAFHALILGAYRGRSEPLVTEAQADEIRVRGEPGLMFTCFTIFIIGAFTSVIRYIFKTPRENPAELPATTKAI